jgi:hypothetical protein
MKQKLNELTKVLINFLIVEFGMSDSQTDGSATTAVTDGIDEEALIEAVRTRGVLYQFGDDDYRNVDKKNDAWKEVAVILNTSGKLFKIRVQTDMGFQIHS